MIAVVALARWQAREHAERAGLGQEGKDWVAVTRPQHARGLRVTSTVVVGNAPMMRDYDYVMVALAAATG